LIIIFHLITKHEALSEGTKNNQGAADIKHGANVKPYAVITSGYQPPDVISAHFYLADHVLLATPARSSS
jgi:hypothetical protein